MRALFKIVVLFIFLLATSMQAIAQPVNEQYDRTRILFLLDASGSMMGDWDKNVKMEVAKNILAEMVDSLALFKDVELGLRVYGHTTHRGKQNCEDTRLEVPFRDGNEGEIVETLERIKPKGTTPIAYSLTQAARDFPKDGRSKNIIILITDGIEECDGDPCAVSQALQKRGVILKPFVIGLGMSEDYTKQFGCVGRYYSAESQRDFGQILSVVVSQALNSTTAQVNLLDVSGKPTETDVNMTFYDMKTKIMRYNYYHTMNERNNPDTFSLDPITKYRMIVHTTPTVEKDSIEIKAGKHNIISLPAPQGELNLKMSGHNVYTDLQAIIKQAGECEKINVQEFNTRHDYLVGRYDIEILSTPPITRRNVKIEQSKTTTLEIPEPGMVSIYTSQSTIGSVYKYEDQELKWICNTNPNVRRELIALQPGSYRIVYRAKSAVRAYYTEEESFKIYSGTTTDINLK